MHVLAHSVSSKHAARIAEAQATVDRALASVSGNEDPAPILQALDLLESHKAYSFDRFAVDGDVVAEILAMRELELADLAREIEFGKQCPAVAAEMRRLERENGHVEARGDALRKMADLQNAQTGISSRRNGRLLRFKELEKFSRAMRALRLMGLGSRGEPLAVAKK
jgi:hypothetical protein